MDPYCCNGIDFDNPCLAEKDGASVDPANNNKCKPRLCNNYEDEPKNTESQSSSTTDNVETGKDGTTSTTAKDAGHGPPSGCTKELDPICCEDKYGIQQEYNNPCIA